MNAKNKIIFAVAIQVTLVFGIFQVAVFTETTSDDDYLEDNMGAIQQEHAQSDTEQESKSEILPSLEHVKQSETIQYDLLYFFVLLLFASNIALIVIIVKILRKEHVKQIEQKKFEAVGELAAKVAHDIRNPLSVVQGALQIMKRDIHDFNEKESQRIEMMENAVQKISYQVAHVLDFVRTKPPTLSENSLLSCLNSVLNSIHFSERITIVKPESDIIFSFDKIQINVVFTNIISNAMQAIHNDGKIKIRFIEKETRVIIEIEDSGPGIPNDVIDSIFEPLYTTKEQGTGLGLSSCKSIVEQHSGTISVKNNPTTFVISLPKNLESE